LADFFRDSSIGGRMSGRPRQSTRRLRLRDSQVNARRIAGAGGRAPSSSTRTARSDNAADGSTVLPECVVALGQSTMAMSPSTAATANDVICFI
jgi:hypothetical protein